MSFPRDFPEVTGMQNNDSTSDWFDDYVDGDDDLQIEEYDITATPNDFNVMTLCSFIDSGSVRIPGFQRNFVWDMARASRLIESLILGLPVPQLFLYEQERNRFLVIDGQQRLMSIYYFMKKRFPRKEKRADIRQIFDQEGEVPDTILHNDQYFQPFRLRLPAPLPGRENRFQGLNYSTLGDYRSQFNLRPIRNIVIKQNSPSDDDSSMFEVFNRLNSGGVNLRPQEIRTSMYHSDFYTMLYRINAEKPEWRRLLRAPAPDLNMKDIEILLRGFAMLVDRANYRPSMVRFLNQFSKKCTRNSDKQNEYLERLFDSFLQACSGLPADAFINKKNKRFNIALYEATFAASIRTAFDEKRLASGTIDADKLHTLETDPEFYAAALEGTTRTANVTQRLTRAEAIVGSL